MRQPRSRATRYLLALAVFAVATLLRWLVDPLIHDQIPYFIYVASVVVATWFCGMDGGIVSTVAAAFGGNYFFVEPRYEFIPHGEDWISMGLFSGVSLGLVWLVGRWKRAERVLHDQADVLRRQTDVLRRQTDELRALHAESESASRMKDEFLATLSHEMRTPLNAIVGWAHMLVEGRLDADKRDHAARTILRNAQGQSRLVNDVLDVSRIVSGKLHLRVKAVDFAAVVSSALDMVRPAADAKSIRLSTNLTAPSILVGDADRLQQVAWNLLSNAVKFTPKGGRVDVRLEPGDSRIVLTVSDTGIGIDPAFLPHLFERFRQADSSITREHGGLGLGLAVVRHMVELHGGTITAESAGANQGATFRVTLPVRAVAVDERLEPVAGGGARATEASADGDEPVLNGTRVLIVDDEADAREMLQAALAQFGAEVRTAAGGPEASTVMETWRPDVLAADIGMPGEDGYSFIRRIRARLPDQGGAIPAIAVTAYARDEDRERALSSGYQQHLPKPVEPRELAVAVRRLAGKRASPGGAA